MGQFKYKKIMKSKNNINQNENTKIPTSQKEKKNRKSILKNDVSQPK
jgi:hypothetical protein